MDDALAAQILKHQHNLCRVDDRPRQRQPFGTPDLVVQLPCIK